MTKKEWVVLAVVGGLGLFVLLGLNVVPGAGVRKAQLRKSLQHAKGIALSLRVYAGDNNGEYPTGEDANRCFAQLVEEIHTEKIFYVSGSAWHGTGKLKDGPDNRWESSDPPGIALDAGENAYAYHRGLNDRSPSGIPFVMSGFSRVIGTYSDDPAELGGVWEGKSCVVVYCDGSGESPKLNKRHQLGELGTSQFQGEGFDIVNPTPPN